MSILIAACWLTSGHGTTSPILANWGLQGRAIPNLFKWNVLVTSYEMVIADSAHLKTIDWRYTVIDEAHRLKNKVCLFASTTQLVFSRDLPFFSYSSASAGQQAGDGAAELRLLGRSAVDRHSAPKQHRGVVVTPQLSRSPKVPVLFPPWPRHILVG